MSTEKYTADGRLLIKRDAVQVSDKFTKREFILQTEGEYPQYLQFQLTQDKCPLLDKFQTGQQVTIHFNIRGKEWTKDGKTSYFNSLEAWRIEAKGSGQHIETVQAEVVQPSDPLGDPSDLPF
jgi:single-strand DNA-binding protein